MPSDLVGSLSAPIRALQESVGTRPVVFPTVALSGIRHALTDVSAAASAARERAGWTGAGGDAAFEFTRATVAAVDALAGRTEGLGAAATGAADAVARARAQLQAIVEDFEARAASLEARIDEPGVAEQLVEEARGALEEAAAVVDGLRAELAVHESAVTQPAGTAPPIPPMPTTPMGAMPSLGSSGGLGGGSGSGLGSGPAESARFANASGLPEARSEIGDLAPPSADPGTFGSGVEVHLPDGSTATAPNAVAASAVRHALTQLGVPYSWGGTTPGVGLDCSGLTQWAYDEAGLQIPRLAQEQDIGAAVGSASLRPGDLAVWDGHVAMIVGNGLMVEAGDPVKLSSVRTTNAGQGFQGFWRPTA